MPIEFHTPVLNEVNLVNRSAVNVMPTSVLFGTNAKIPCLKCQGRDHLQNVQKGL